MTFGAIRARLTATLLAVVMSGGCISVHRPWFMEPTIDRDWDSTLLLARVRAAEGKFPAADSLLARFAAQYPGTREAIETSYWRALFDLDPSNHLSSFSNSIASLDQYLAQKRPLDHAAEAATLRRIAGHMDQLNKLAATALAEARDTSVAMRVTAPDVRGDVKPAVAGDVASPTPADVEIKRLKDELAKANAELERIRRRLAQPPPPLKP
jgi:hypothetical protein